MAQNIDQCINDFSHRIMKEMQLLMGERYPLYIYCHGFVRCESLRFDQCFRHEIFINLNLPILLRSAGKTARKITKILGSLTFNKNLNDTNLCSSLGVTNFQMWELFLAHPVFGLRFSSETHCRGE